MRLVAMWLLGAVVLILTPQESSAQSILQGTYKLSVHVHTSLAVAAASSITCSVTLDVEPDDGPSLTETASVGATTESGYYLCTLTLPYSWTVNSTTGSVYPSLDVQVAGTTETRNSLAIPLASFSLPATGATTSQSAVTKE